MLYILNKIIVKGLYFKLKWKIIMKLKWNEYNADDDDDENNI